MRLSRFLTTTLVGASMGFFTSCGSVQLGSSVGANEAGEPVESEQASFEVERLTGGLEHPWGMAFLPEGGMLVTERGGSLRLVNADFSLEPEPARGRADGVFTWPGRAARCGAGPGFRGQPLGLSELFLPRRRGGGRRCRDGGGAWPAGRSCAQ